MGFKVWGVGFKVWDVGFKVWGVWFKVWGVWFKVWGVGLESQGFPAGQCWPPPSVGGMPGASPALRGELGFRI